MVKAGEEDEFFFFFFFWFGGFLLPEEGWFLLAEFIVEEGYNFCMNKQRLYLLNVTVEVAAV